MGGHPGVKKISPEKTAFPNPRHSTIHKLPNQNPPPTNHSRDLASRKIKSTWQLLLQIKVQGNRDWPSQQNVILPRRFRRMLRIHNEAPTVDPMLGLLPQNAKSLGPLKPPNLNRHKDLKIIERQMLRPAGHQLPDHLPLPPRGWRVCAPRYQNRREAYQHREPKTHQWHPTAPRGLHWNRYKKTQKIKKNSENASKNASRDSESPFNDETPLITPKNVVSLLNFGSSANPNLEGNPDFVLRLFDRSWQFLRLDLKKTFEEKEKIKLENEV